MFFLDYTGVYTRSGERYIFKMKNNKKKSSKFYTVLSNPTYDNSFKNMFTTEKSVLKSFLNSVLFPRTQIIEKIEFSKTNFSGKKLVNNRYGYGTKSIDVGCKLYLKKNNTLNIKDNRLMCDVEMQIGFSSKIEQRFLDYANKIRVDSNFKDTWVVSFILKESLDDGNNYVKLKKIDSDGVVQTKDFQSIKLIEVNLNYCNSLLKNDEDIEIIDGEILDISGKEWIKMLCMPLWCKTVRNNENLYILPKLNKQFIKCIYLRKAMEKIVYTNKHFDLSDVDEHYNRRERKEYAKMKEEIEELKKINEKLVKKIEKYEKEDDEEDEDYDDDEEQANDEKEEELDEQKADEDDENIIEEDDNKMDLDSD